MRNPVLRALDWIDDRIDLRATVDEFFSERIPASAGWPQVLGSVALFVLLKQAFTGVLLASNHSPTPDDAYASIGFIVRRVAAGKMVRALHHWGASLIVIVVVAHMCQVFLYGAYKRPPEVTWLTGVTLLLFTLGFSLTGYLLPRDNNVRAGRRGDGASDGAGPVFRAPATGLDRGPEESAQITITIF
jgi:ubiquinol-cytochrome c reductase cytochrome b subunit